MFRKVLVVDAAPERANASAQALKELGYAPTVFPSGDACLDALAQAGELPLLVVISLDLTPMSGDECCRRIKENHAWRGVAVITVTSVADPHQVMRCWRAAADDFLLHPLSAEQLGPKLQMLTRARAERPVAQPQGGKSVLVAEPSRFYRTQIGQNLEQAGLQVLYATEGEEALDMAEEHAASLDACLLDVALPGIDGVAIAEQLRQRADFGKKPIIMVSAAEAMSPATHEAARRLTGSALLDKRTLPFERILTAVHRSLHPNLAQLRSSERIPFFSVVDFSVDGATWSTGFSYDLSAGGLFVRTLTPAPPHTELRLQVRSVSESSSEHSSGVVAWANPYWPRSSFTAAVGMGIRLTHMAPRLAMQVSRLARQREQSR